VDTSAPLADRSFGDFAVLFRTARQAEVIAGIFAQAGIPYQMASRQKILNQKGIAELLALFRLTQDAGTSRDFAAGARALRPVLEKSLVNAFLDWKEHRGLSLSQAMAAQSEIPGDVLTHAQQQRLHAFLQALEALKTKLQNSQTPTDRLIAIDRYSAVRELTPLALVYEDTFRRLLDWAAACQADSARFLDRLALQRDVDTLREGVEKVSLLTMHAAKGLEFPVVFITGCENGLMPFFKKDGDTVDLEGERRLFYVAMTRAREQLYLSWSRRRMLYGQKREQLLSPFVAEIEKRLLAHQSFAAGKKRRGRQVQLKLF
jgi:superfamily I DNA/RNA helicase